MTARSEFIGAFSRSGEPPQSLTQRAPESEEDEERQLWEEEDNTKDKHNYPPYHENTTSVTHKDDTLATHSTASDLANHRNNLMSPTQSEKVT